LPYAAEQILRYYYAADEGGSMRKVVATELVSLDSVMEKPEEWAFSYSNDEMEQANASGMAASDALLLGRVTYEGLAAFWPNQPAGTPMVDYINSVPKFVVSGTLEEPLGWNNSTYVLHFHNLGREDVMTANFEVVRRWKQRTARRYA
jgi:dihydrofolate reductase